MHKTRISEDMRQKGIGSIGSVPFVLEAFARMMHVPTKNILTPVCSSNIWFEIH